MPNVHRIAEGDQARPRSNRHVQQHRQTQALARLASDAPHDSGGVVWDPPSYGFRQHSFFDMPLVGKTEVFRWTFDAVPPDIARYLDSGGHVAAFICLHEGGKAPLLLPMLSDLAAVVETVLRRFAVFLR
jgi:hypothetical protein